MKARRTKSVPVFGATLYYENDVMHIQTGAYTSTQIHSSWTGGKSI